MSSLSYVAGQNNLNRKLKKKKSCLAHICSKLYFHNMRMCDGGGLIKIYLCGKKLKRTNVNGSHR